MKKLFYSFFLLASTLAFSQVGIGTTSPNKDSILHLESTNKGILLPRVTDVTTTTIPKPVNGLIVYDESANCVKAFENNSWTNCLVN